MQDEERTAATSVLDAYRGPLLPSAVTQGALAPEGTSPGLQAIGPFSGEVSNLHRTAELLVWLAELPALLNSPSATVLGSGRNSHVRIEAPLRGTMRAVVVKTFGRLSLLRDLRDRRRGSKARRTWLAAQHLNANGVGTPEPIGYLDRWERGRLVESYFVAIHEAQAETLRMALATLFNEHPEAANFMDLLECVAQGVRAMHDAGFIHHDLGAQNILLTPDGPGRWRRFQVVDLNRGRIRDSLSVRERALDLSRLALPSHLRRLFVKMYWHGHPPRDMLQWEDLYSRLHRWRVRSRRWRHPIREARIARQGTAGPARTAYPAPRDMWIWDERSAQPIAALLRRERNLECPPSRSARMVVDTLNAAGAVWREYHPLLEGAFARPVSFAGRIGMAVDASTLSLDRELALLAGLGRIPAFVRFGHHESRDRRQSRTGLVRALHRAGHPVAIGLTQDRNALRRPDSWRNFTTAVLEEVGNLVEMVEVGHGINRTKWGIWGFDDLAALYAPIRALHARFPGVRFTGPAAIDFEYPFVLSALREWPRGVPLAALSHHLYVDRRGAPENAQGRFGALEKFALARAIARASPVCDDRLVVSEVNWPLEGTGAHCPVGSPYVFAGQRSGNAAVNEDDYADYMLRYLCLAIGSGLVDRVYWWRLVARGFGLVDDTRADAPRPRAAYTMLRTFLSTLGDGTLVSARLPARHGNREGRYRLAFQRPDGEAVVLTYVHGAPAPFPGDERFGYVQDASGATLDRPPARLTGRPVYLRESRA